jgi:acetyl-CoA carboxylase biotin carboxylase subunit
MTKIRKILIANRGEIAVRIIRTCKEMDIRTVSVYSDADRLSPHVLMADEAYPIGPAQASESYINIEKILETAKKSKVQAIHPGYGFLAENPKFANQVQKSGLIFIGPNPNTIRLMGSKTESRKNMIRAGVPVVPGSKEIIKSMKQAKSVVENLGGYPLLIKASAGGGGKGMRVVRAVSELTRALDASKNEALKAFGDSTIYIEKYLESPKHIEIQIFGDQQRNFIHLGERDCSIQRRHQKIIEESPATIITPEKREEMGKIAIQAAKACRYIGAGTVEFLFDKKGNFYFLEMNTRLQVEHPVTELVTGLDLVKLQIQIAEGEPIPFKQDEVSFKGHAIECRIYAEDSLNNFLPSTGKIRYVNDPDGPGIRLDSGISHDSEISMYYDPLISKLIVWASTRNECMNRMRRALQEYKIGGVKTSIPFCLRVMEHPSYIQGNFGTDFIDLYLDNIKKQIKSDKRVAELAAITIAYQKEKMKQEANKISSNSKSISNSSKWKLRRMKVNKNKFF